MGWKSTLYITREDCLAEILKRVHLASDEALANVLEDIGESDGEASVGIVGHNFTVISAYDDEHPRSVGE